MEETKEYVSKTSEVITGTIMDAVQMSEENNKQREAMEAAISNDQMKKFEALAKAWQEAHTQKVRKYDKIGRNDPCPCGAVDENGKPKKFKNCCMKKKNWDELVPIKK